MQCKKAAIAEGITQAGDQYALNVQDCCWLNEAFEQFFVDRQAIALSVS